MRFREPARFQQLRDAFEAWSTGLPPVPEDATYGVIYTEKTMARSNG
jgi:hypothetical protein